MVAIDPLRFACTRLPRTGSSWCYGYLKSCFPDDWRKVNSWDLGVFNHSPWCECMGSFGGYCSYVQVRDPYRWLMSVYGFVFLAREGQEVDFPHPFPRVPRSGGGGFRSWVQCVCGIGWLDKVYRLYTQGVRYVGVCGSETYNLHAALLDCGAADIPLPDSVARANASGRLPGYDTGLRDLVYTSQAESFGIYSRACGGGLWGV